MIDVLHELRKQHVNLMRIARIRFICDGYLQVLDLKLLEVEYCDYSFQFVHGAVFRVTITYLPHPMMLEVHKYDLQ